MAQKKPYNSNTSYGRKKLREQAQINYNILTENEKKDWDATGFVILFIIILVIIIYVITTGDSKGALKWLSK